MKEDLLHYMWRTKQFALTNLRTTQGQALEILNFGVYNRVHGGPDFENCTVVIDGIQWVGSVEMHLASSDWYRHAHQGDPRYGTVVLHVVLEEDKLVTVGGSRLPCLEVKRLIDPAIVSRYAKLQQVGSWVPCSAHLVGVDRIVVIGWLERMLIERIEQKLGPFETLVASDDWKRILLILIGRSLGSKVNSDPMEDLASKVPFDLLRELRKAGRSLEVLFLGLAGMLNRVFSDSYCAQLYVEFIDIADAWALRPMDRVAWQTGGVRPSNQPALRIVQFAGIALKLDAVFEQLLEVGDVKQMRRLFAVQLPEYWMFHYDLEKESKRKIGTIGVQTVDGILINAVLPFLFLYARHHNLFDLQSRTMNVYSSLRPENNHITRRWEMIGAPNENAGNSQALLHLKRNYCNVSRCLECSIGNHILSKSA